MSIKEIETKIATTLKSETGLDVEVTMRGENEWTVSGYDAVSAAEWLQSNGILTLTDTADYDDDPGFTFCYMTRS